MTSARPMPPRAGRSPVTIVVALFVLVLAIAVVGIAVVRANAGSPATGRWYQPAAAASSAGTDAKASPSAAAATEQISMSAVGDVIMGVPPNLPPNNGKGFFDDVQSSLRADLQMANLEEPLTNDTGVTKCSAATLGNTCFQFRSPPSYANILSEAGFGLVNLANNHAYDFGPAGHTNTRAALDAAGVRYTGPPGMITVVDVKGIKVAVIGFAPYPWANDLLNIPKGQDLVRQAKKQADLVVIQVHMGAEGANYTHVKPGTEMYVGENRGDPIAFSHAMVDAGADVIIGHSPHVLRAMEFYKGHLIAYSLGNFAGYHNFGLDGVLGASAVLHVRLTAKGIFHSGRITSVRLVDAGMPEPDPAAAGAQLIAQLSRDDLGSRAVRVTPAGRIAPP